MLQDKEMMNTVRRDTNYNGTKVNMTGQGHGEDKHDGTRSW